MRSLFFLFFPFLVFSQDTIKSSNDSVPLFSNDTINTDTLSAKEINFQDSIKELNLNNLNLKKSRDYYNTALELMREKKYNEAIIKLNKSITIDSLFVNAFLRRAECYFFTNKDSAIINYLHVFSLDSTMVKCLYEIANIEIEFDENAAFKTYSRIINFDNNQSQAYYKRGVILFSRKKYEEAIKDFSNSLDILKDAYTYNERAACYRMLGMLDKAEDDYLASITLNSDLSFVYNNLGSVLRKQGFKEKALIYYNFSIAKDSTYFIAYNNRAGLLIENNDFETAIKDIDKCLDINPKYAPAFNNRGVYKHSKKDYKAAVEDFNQAIHLNENYAKAYLNRGISKQMIRDEYGACQDWKKASLFNISIANKYLISDCE